MDREFSEENNIDFFVAVDVWGFKMFSLFLALFNGNVMFNQFVMGCVCSLIDEWFAVVEAAFNVLRSPVQKISERALRTFALWKEEWEQYVQSLCSFYDQGEFEAAEVVREEFCEKVEAWWAGIQVLSGLISSSLLNFSSSSITITK